MKKNQKKKDERIKARDYVTLGEINHGTGGAHKNLKDKQKNRNSKQSKREKDNLKKYLG